MDAFQLLLQAYQKICHKVTVRACIIMLHTLMK
jgi:hypothetical protein